MKILRFIVLGLLIGFMTDSFGQTEIYGTWDVGCATEKIKNNTLGYCAICAPPKTDAVALEIANIEITLDDKTIKIGNGMPLMYTWDNVNGSIRFTYNDIAYYFMVLNSGIDNIMVWKEYVGGCVLVFHKK